MKRIYEALVKDHFEEYRQMAFISGPRQVGKTTLAKNALPKARYFNYDNSSDRLLIRKGAAAIANDIGLDSLPPKMREVIFDEVHKNPKWKSFLKGFFDVYGDRKLKIAATGSARMNIYKRGGDSLMGRYFSYRLHPLSAGEIASPAVDLKSIFQKPKKIPLGTLEKLLAFGGYPEPFIAADKRFYNRWRDLRLEQLFNDDLRDLSRVQDTKGIRLLAELLASRICSGINYTTFANELDVSVVTIKAWLNILESVFYCYSIRPWSKNITNSIRKQPKFYLWDWTLAKDKAAAKENLLASHLLKSVHWWTDSGLGKFDLFYVRDKNQKEVDFLVSKDGKPFMLVECKSSSNDNINKALVDFQKKLKAPYAFQTAFDMPISNENPSAYNTPIKISILDLLKILI